MGKGRRPRLEVGGRTRRAGPRAVLRDTAGAGARRAPGLPEAPRLPNTRHRQLPGLQKEAGLCPPLQPQAPQPRALAPRTHRPALRPRQLQLGLVLLAQRNPHCFRVANFKPQPQK